MKIAIKEETIQKVLKIGRWVCLPLALALLVCQFIPFWTVNDKSISIAQYIWLPTYLKDVTKVFAAEYPEFASMNAFGGAPLICLFGSGAVIFMTLFKKHLSIVFGGLLALTGGAAISCVTIPVYHHLSNILWLVQAIIGGVALVVGLVVMIAGIIELRVAISKRTW
jgi:hypothetical protein